MTNAHVCDNCKTVAPLEEAIGWWSLTSIEGIIYFGEKHEYHFCSWPCLSEFSAHHIAAVERARQ